MSNPNKRKGASFELLVQRYIDEVLPCSRIPAGRSDDLGDLWVPAPFAIQCKNQAQLSLGAWLQQTLEQAANAKKTYSWLVVKRRGSNDPANQFAITSLENARAITLRLLNDQ